MIEEVPEEKVTNVTYHRGMCLRDKLPAIFTYHAPEPGMPERYQVLREKALELAQVIVDVTPVCADQAAAIRLLREAVMTANASIALNGLI